MKAGTQSAEDDKHGVGQQVMGDALRNCRGLFITAAVFSAFLNLLYLAPTLYMLQVYDRVIPSHGGVTLLMLTGIFVAATLTIALLDLARTRLLGAISYRLDRLLAGAVMDGLLRVARGSGMARNATVLREFDALRQVLTGIGVLALFDVPWAPIYILACMLLHWALGVMALAGCLLLTVLSWWAERATHDVNKQANRRAQQSFMAIDGTLATAGTVNALGMREAMVQRHVVDRAQASLAAAQAAHSSAAFTSSVKALRLTMQSLALGLGAYLAINQQISPGAIFAASLLVSRALAPIEMITGAWKGLVQARESYRMLIDVFDARGALRIHTTLPAPMGRVSVEGLAVMSPARDRLLLQGLSFDLAPGEMLGVIGPSGAGKSTLVKAMVGINSAMAGVVRYDGAALDDWPEQQLTQAVGYVPQEPTLYRGTIKENIARFDTELGLDPEELDREVIRAAQLCGAHDFILRLPQGYDTELGWGGVGLSGGQAQRITLARALYNRPRVLILDEPNAHLDAIGQEALLGAFRTLRAQGVTIIIVAHTQAVLNNADKLLVIRDGRMDMFGSRQAVLAQQMPGNTVAQSA
ncbi:MAG: type I secretion system permease/ATPase [Sphingomonadales bacterium]|nr:type I secretion system permease/ATPase [Sphingomonadales bacterium]MDE2168519.1 type I secretion system permease/ATPase [Sphingomonadales bacterium]